VNLIEEWDSCFPDFRQTGAGMTGGPEEILWRQAPQMKLHKIIQLRIAHALAVMPAHAGIPLTV